MNLLDIEVSFERVRVMPMEQRAGYFVNLRFADGRKERISWFGSMNPDAEEFFRDVAASAIEARDATPDEYARKHGLSAYRGKEEHGYCRILLSRMREIFGDEDKFFEMVGRTFDCPGPSLI